MPKTCEKCGSNFPFQMEIDGRIRNFGNRRYCLDCSPFGSRNTRTLENSEQNGLCKECGRVFDYDRSKGHKRRTCNSCCVIKAQRNKKQKAVNYLGGKCSKCGYSKCLAALEFHHIEDKEESPSYVILRWSWERAKKELDKCVLLCSNCHREEHERMLKENRVQSLSGKAPDS